MVACPGKVMYVTHDHILSLYATSIEKQLLEYTTMVNILLDAA